MRYLIIATLLFVGCGEAHYACPEQDAGAPLRKNEAVMIVRFRITPSR